MTTQKFHQFYRTVLSIQKKYLAGNYPEVKVEMVHDEIIGYYEGFLNSVSNREGKYIYLLYTQMEELSEKILD